MSSAPRSNCTECLKECRTYDVNTFPMCSKHRVCNACMAKRGPRPNTAAGRDQCPVCSESRRRVGVTVRTRIWSEELVKKACVACCAFGPGRAVMKCGHAYCVSCFRRLPRSAHSRTPDGQMARGCQDCEKKAGEERRERTRAAMERAEEDARMKRDIRETREFREDSKLVTEKKKRPNEKTAPRTARRILTVPVTASFEAGVQDGGASAKPIGKKQAELSKRSEAAAAVDGACLTDVLDQHKRRVSFDPHVYQRLISPRGSHRTRRSLPHSSLASLLVASDPLHNSGSSHSGQFHGSLLVPEPHTPRQHRSFHRGWGISSP